MLGLLSNEDLERELRRASIGLVTQRADVLEFNVPSKLMNFMAYGLPVLACVRPDSEVARLVAAANCGWIVDSEQPHRLAEVAATALGSADELETRGQAAREFAARYFDPAAMAATWEGVLRSVAR
jgi:colanic acid biosynthesis glycosyl transferase WcaI